MKVFLIIVHFELFFFPFVIPFMFSCLTPYFCQFFPIKSFFHCFGALGLDIKGCDFFIFVRVVDDNNSQRQGSF
jgi:hypothetical protein